MTIARISFLLSLWSYFLNGPVYRMTITSVRVRLVGEVFNASGPSVWLKIAGDGDMPSLAMLSVVVATDSKTLRVDGIG